VEGWEIFFEEKENKPMTGLNQIRF